MSVGRDIKQFNTDLTAAAHNTEISQRVSLLQMHMEANVAVCLLFEALSKFILISKLHVQNQENSPSEHKVKEVMK